MESSIEGNASCQGVNTQWDRELIRRLNTRRRATSGTVPAITRLLIVEKEKQKEQPTEGLQVQQPGTNFISPFWKLHQELMDKKAKMRISSSLMWTEEKVSKRISILDGKNKELKKMVDPPKKPLQEFPMVRRLTSLPSQAHLETRKTYSVTWGDMLKKHPLGKTKHFLEFSSLPSNVLSDLSKVNGGETAVFMMKSMKPSQWEKVIRYYGVFSRAGRIDRTILYYLVLEASDQPLEQPTCKEVLKRLDPDPHEALFLLGKIIMTVYHGIVIQSESPSMSCKPLSLHDILTKIEIGYKSLKTKVRKQRGGTSI